jgi:hypothetical protein
MDQPVVPSRTRATQPASIGGRMTALGMAHSASDAVHGTSVLPDMSAASVGVRIGENIRTLVCLVNAACR